MHWGPFNAQLWLPECTRQLCLPQGSAAAKAHEVDSQGGITGMSKSGQDTASTDLLNCK